VGHKPRNTPVAVKKRVHPQQAMMSRGSRNDRVRPADFSVNTLEALKEARQSAGADSDVLPDLNVMAPQFSGYHTNSLLSKTANSLN
jgi:hypothetical protein